MKNCATATRAIAQFLRLRSAKIFVARNSNFLATKIFAHYMSMRKKGKMDVLLPPLKGEVPEGRRGSDGAFSLL